ncbi:MAG: hypothetical protein K8F91_25820, partial [Candidatus Obscuribacterales bacterium]|nr:hypothetical protein [Candidatus Obscuribacterales bacterium]
MEPESAPFSLAETVNTVWQAALAVICHILFDAALHGFVLAFCIGMAGFLLRSKKHKFGRPLLAASRKLAILCIGVSIPGALTIAFTGGLPDTGNYSVHSIGFIVFWSMVSVHLVGEE